MKFRVGWFLSQGRLSVIFLAIIVIVGGAGIANYMFSNVYERRREIGTLMALGAESGIVLRIFLLKALLLGLVDHSGRSQGVRVGRRKHDRGGRNAALPLDGLAAGQYKLSRLGWKRKMAAPRP